MSPPAAYLSLHKHGHRSADWLLGGQRGSLASPRSAALGGQRADPPPDSTSAARLAWALAEELTPSVQPAATTVRNGGENAFR